MLNLNIGHEDKSLATCNTTILLSSDAHFVVNLHTGACSIVDDPWMSWLNIGTSSASLDLYTW